MAVSLFSFSAPAPTPALAAADIPTPMAIPADMSCGVCGMYPARYPKWQTQIIFKDGHMVPFDGAKDMFKYILNMKNYAPDRNRNDIAAVWVREFNNGEWLDGHKAIYVIGSKEMGPMGKELIPYANLESARTFMADNGGEIIHFTEVSLPDIKKLGMGGMKMKDMKMGEMKMENKM